MVRVRVNPKSVPLCPKPTQHPQTQHKEAPTARVRRVFRCQTSICAKEGEEDGHADLVFGARRRHDEIETRATASLAMASASASPAASPGDGAVSASTGGKGAGWMSEHLPAALQEGPMGAVFAGGVGVMALSLGMGACLLCWRVSSSGCPVVFLASRCPVSLA